MATILVTTNMPFSNLFIEDVQCVRCDDTGVATYEGSLNDKIVKHWESLGYNCVEAKEVKADVKTLEELTKK